MQKGLTMQKKKLLYNLTLALSSIIITLLVIEVGIRLVLPSQRHLAMYQRSGSDNHVLMPNLNLRYNQKEFSHSVITNSAGFRNKEELVNKDIILFIGDSFTFGSGVDEEYHYSHIFDKLLNWNEKKFNIYNAGVPGYSTIDELIYIRGLINRGLDIKKVLLGIDISDFNENLLFPIYDIQDGYLVFSTKDKKGAVVSGLNFLAANSELVNFLYYRVVHSSVLKNYLASIFSNLKYLHINLPDRNLQLFARQKNDISEKKLTVFKEHLTKIIELCKASNIELYVYYLPMIQEIYKDNYQNTLATYSLKEEDFNLTFLNGYIEQICTENGARFLDIKKDLLRSNSERLYYFVDQHFTRYGNLITGISIYNGYQDDKRH